MWACRHVYYHDMTWYLLIWCRCRFPCQASLHHEQLVCSLSKYLCITLISWLARRLTESYNSALCLHTGAWIQCEQSGETCCLVQLEMHVSLESGHYPSSIILPFFFSELTGQNVSVLLVLFSCTQYTFLIQTLFTHGLVKLLAGFFAAAEHTAVTQNWSTHKR